MSPAERVLWSRLRGQRTGGLRFRRQHPLGPFIADFYCHDAALVVEVDGAAFHRRDQLARDAQRDRWMKDRNLSVIRIPASSIARDVDAVARRIERAATACIEQLRAGDGIEK